MDSQLYIIAVVGLLIPAIFIYFFVEYAHKKNQFRRPVLIVFVGHLIVITLSLIILFFIGGNASLLVKTTTAASMFFISGMVYEYISNLIFKSVDEEMDFGVMQKKMYRYSLLGCICSFVAGLFFLMG